MWLCMCCDSLWYPQLGRKRERERTEPQKITQHTVCTHPLSPFSSLLAVLWQSSLFQSVEQRAQHMSRMIAPRSSYLGLSYIYRQLVSARYRPYTMTFRCSSTALSFSFFKWLLLCNIEMVYRVLPSCLSTYVEEGPPLSLRSVWVLAGYWSPFPVPKGAE